MPFEMGNYVQSVVVQGRLYVVGGWAGWGSNYIVMEYDIGSGEWTTLPRYRACNFAMAVISNQLVLVGGDEQGGCSKVLGVWGADRKVWTHPYPDMPTARSKSSAVVYNEWLVVVGGVASGKPLSNVEVMNTGSGKWYTTLPTPTPWYSMKTAVVGDLVYFMGGNSMGYCVCIPTLLSHITSKASSGTDRQIWKEVPELHLRLSTPLSISGSLLAVGGMDKDYKAVTAIHLYQPDSVAWVKVGDLPFPRYNCTCAMTTDRKLLVAGGGDGGRQYLKRVDVALIA